MARKPKPFFDLDAVLNDKIREEQKTAVKAIHSFYEDLCEAGFDKDQALELIKATLMMSAAKNGGAK